MKKTAGEMQDTVQRAREGKIDMRSRVLGAAGELFAQATTKENVRSFVSVVGKLI